MSGIASQPFDFPVVYYGKVGFVVVSNMMFLTSKLAKCHISIHYFTERILQCSHYCLQADNCDNENHTSYQERETKVQI